MYIFQQYKNQFIRTFFSFQEGGELGGTAGTPEGPSGLSSHEQERFSHLSPDQQRRLLALQDYGESIEELERVFSDVNASEQIVAQRVRAFGNARERIANGQIPGLSPEDPEYQRISEMHDRFLEEYRSLTAEGAAIHHIVLQRLSELQGEVQEQRSEIIYQEDQDYNTLQDRREAFIPRLGEISDTTPEAQLAELAQQFGTRNVHLWIQDLREELIEADTDTQRQEVQQRISQLQRLMAAVDTREFENADELQTLLSSDFIAQIPQSERLPYFVRGDTSLENLEPGQILEMTFTYEGVHNPALERLTAGQVFPENVSMIVVDGVEYHRRGLLGEFYTQPQDGGIPRRLFIRESESVQIGVIRSSDDIVSQRQEIEEQLESFPENERELRRAALERGLGDLDAGTIQLLQDIVPELGQEGRGAALETAVTDMAERVGPRTALEGQGGDLGALRSRGLIGFLLASLFEAFQGQSGEEFAGRTGYDSPSDYAGGIGISPEDVERYGNTGAELAQWLQSSGYPVYNGQPFYCGQNVGMALDAFGIEGLPNSGRHGYRWADICASRPSQFQRVNCTPQEAPAGAIISYNRGTGGSEARQGYGHVEIALGQNRGYYFGQVARSPGGSNPNFAPGTYQIYVPTSKVA